MRLTYKHHQSRKRGSYYIQVHLSFIQHTNLEIDWIPYVVIYSHFDSIISFKEHDLEQSKWFGHKPLGSRVLILDG